MEVDTGMFYAGLGSAIAALSMLIYMAVIVRKAKKAELWPTVEGEVVISELEAKLSVDNDRPSRKVFRAGVYYSYQVQGKNYHGKRVYFDSDVYSSNIESAKKMVETYPKGKKVQVFYHPHFPEKAVLQPTYSRKMALFVTGAGVVFLVTGIVLMINSGYKF